MAIDADSRSVYAGIPLTKVTLHTQIGTAATVDRATWMKRSGQLRQPGTGGVRHGFVPHGFGAAAASSAPTFADVKAEAIDRDDDEDAAAAYKEESVF
jgi:hypothetical protein